MHCWSSDGNPGTDEDWDHHAALRPSGGFLHRQQIGFLLGTKDRMTSAIAQGQPVQPNSENSNDYP